MVLGLKVSEIPPFGGKKFNILTTLNIMCIVTSFGSLANGHPWRAALPLSLTTLMRRSISGTCSLLLVRLTTGPLGNDSIKGFNGSNSPSTSTSVTKKTRFLVC